MNLTDLRDVLDERSATGHAEARSHLLLGAVYDRLAARRRRRRAASIAGAGVGLAAVGVAAFAIAPSPGGTPTAPSPTAAPTGRSVEGFAEYANGAKVIAAAAAGARDRSVSVTFVPTSLDLGVFTRCAGDGDYTVTINGRRYTSGSGCGLAYVKTAQPLEKAYGVTVGRPATATFSATDGPVDSLAIAIGQSVDPAVYPYPPRPATLIPLEHPGESRRMAYLTPEDYYAGEWGLAAEYGNWNKPQSAQFTWGEPVQVNVQAQTPGALTVRVNGIEVVSQQWWDYQQGRGTSINSAHWKESLGLNLRKGQVVHLTVTPARMTGDWYVHIQHTGEQPTD